MSTPTKTYGVDWGHGKKIAVHGSDGPVDWTGTLRAFIESHAPCGIVIESTFESFNVEEKNAVIARAQELGCHIMSLSGRITSNFRKRHGLKKSDASDAETIYKIFEEQRVHFTKPRMSPVKERSPLEQAEYLRHLNFKPAKLTKPLMSHLPSRANAPKEILEILGNGKNYSIPMVIPIIAAALEASTRDEFDKTIGSYGSGYPSYLRSNFYYSRTRTLTKNKRSADVKQARKQVNALYEAGKTDEYEALRSRLLLEERSALKQSMKDLRRASRWVFHQVRSAMGKFDPEMGNRNPDAGL